YSWTGITARAKFATSSAAPALMPWLRLVSIVKKAPISTTTARRTPASPGGLYQDQLLQVRGRIGRGIVRFEVGTQCVRDVVHPSGLSWSNHCCRCVVARGGLPSHEFRNAHSRQIIRRLC